MATFIYRNIFLCTEIVLIYIKIKIALLDAISLQVKDAIILQVTYNYGCLGFQNRCTCFRLEMVNGL